MQQEDGEKLESQTIADQRFNQEPGGSLVGTTLLDRYEILEIIGEGGMGTVYKARHKLIGKYLAIKVLQPRLAGDEASLARFHREARAASNLNHPHLIAVNDFGVTASGAPFFIMEYVEGRNLSELLKDKPLEIERFRRLFWQAASGLAQAHASGVIHRDLKPTNLMIEREGKPDESVKIVDFGIAKPIALDEKAREMTLTKTGTVFGSPPYMSPEQCQGKKVDALSDIYSLGCTMYESLTGRAPFQSPSFLETMMKHITEPPPSLSYHRPEGDFPAELDWIIQTCLAKIPEQRFQSMNDLMTALEKLPSSAQAPQERQKKGAGNKKLIVGAAASLAVVAGSLFVAFKLNSDKPDTSINSTGKRAATNVRARLLSSEEIKAQIQTEKRISGLMTDAGESFAQEKFDQSCQEYRKALGLWATLPDGSVKQHFDLLFRFGDSARSAHRWDESIDSYEKAMAVLENMGQGHSREMAQTLLRRGVVSFHIRKYNEAIPFLEKALSIQESIEGKGTAYDAEIGSWLAECYVRATPPDLARAIDMFQWSEKPYKYSAYFEKNDAHAEVLLRQVRSEGHCLLRLGRYKEMEERMREGIKDANSLLRDDHPHKDRLIEYRTGLTQLLVRALRHLGKNDEAKKYEMTLAPAGNIDHSSARPEVKR